MHLVQLVGVGVKEESWGRSVETEDRQLGIGIGDVPMQAVGERSVLGVGRDLGRGNKLNWVAWASRSARTGSRRLEIIVEVATIGAYGTRSRVGLGWWKWRFDVGIGIGRRWFDVGIGIVIGVWHKLAPVDDVWLKLAPVGWLGRSVSFCW